MEIKRKYIKEGVCFEVSAMAVVLCNGKILTTNEIIFGKNVLSLPKGHQEKDEDLLQTAIRECFEETDIIIDGKDCIKKLTPFTYEFLSQDNRLIKKTNHPYLFCVNNEGVPAIKEEGIVAVRWMDIKEFQRTCTHANIKKLMDEVFELIII